MTDYFPKAGEPTAMDVATLSARLRSGQLSPVELLAAVLDRIGQLQGPLNAFITVREEAAMADAKAAEAEIAADRYRGPLHGIPFSVKDLILTARLRTTFGSSLFKDHVPVEDAVPVARLKQAGAILVGKTTTPAFGHKPATDGQLFGRTVNPYDPNVTCGGSSGGAAVAVATGQAPLALGTDGGGSVRIPAACCGIVGLKATMGVIPHVHVPDLFGANSFIGPMGRSVADVAAMFAAIAGPDRRDPYGQGKFPDPDGRPLNGLRIGWLPTVGNEQVDAETLAAAADAVRQLEKSGATVEETEIDFVALEDSFLVFLQSALCARLDVDLRARPEAFDGSLAKTIELGRQWTAVDLHKANAERSRAFNAVQALFETFDLLVSPTLACPPLSTDQDSHGHVRINGRDAGRIRAAWYPYTYPFNLTGHPAIAVPRGHTARRGLPLSVQIVGPWHGEALLFRAAAEIELARP